MGVLGVVFRGSEIAVTTGTGATKGPAERGSGRGACGGQSLWACGGCGCRLGGWMVELGGGRGVWVVV